MATGKHTKNGGKTMGKPCKINGFHRKIVEHPSGFRKMMKEIMDKHHIYLSLPVIQQQR
jgi:hypothetical protein